MISVSDFRNGVTFDMDGKVMQIIEFQHVKPGKGAAFVRVKMRNVITGGVTETTFNPNDKYPTAYIERRKMDYSYNDGNLYYFMDPETFEMTPSSFPEEVDVALDFRCDNIHELNELALAVEKFSIHDRKKLGAAVSMAKPENASQIRRLAENMDLFEFAPGAHTPAEYGKYMIQKSGHFEYDPNLDEFYDYERYGLQHMDYQSGVFTERGYIAYVGTVDLEELMAEGPVDQCQREQEVQMGGMA